MLFCPKKHFSTSSETRPRRGKFKILGWSPLHLSSLPIYCFPCQPFSTLISPPMPVLLPYAFPPAPNLMALHIQYIILCHQSQLQTSAPSHTPPKTPSLSFTEF